jgi:hypothetical protein
MNKQSNLREAWMGIYEHEIYFQIFFCDGNPKLITISSSCWVGNKLLAIRGNLRRSLVRDYGEGETFATIYEHYKRAEAWARLYASKVPARMNPLDALIFLI